MIGGKKPEKTFTNSIGMEFVLISTGRFVMGSPEHELGRYQNEGQKHEVQISRQFYFGKYEVKVGEFRQFVRETGYKTEAEIIGRALNWIWTNGKGDFHKKAGAYWDNPGRVQTDIHPVTCVSRNDATEFCRWLSKKEGGTYRLPTEAEWEYACRVGTLTARFWGEDPDKACQYANVGDQGWRSDAHSCEDGYINSAPVGSFRPNGFGLHDILGNAYEMVSDWYDKSYYKYSPHKDPTYGLSEPIMRGGSFINAPRRVRCALRVNVDMYYRADNVGFRVVRTAD